MSRSGYSEDCDYDWRAIMYRDAVASAFRGRRGQAFLREMLTALDALPEKKLISYNLIQADGCVCALGAVGKARGMEMSDIDPEDRDFVAGAFGQALAMISEIMFENDEGGGYWNKETPTQRFARMRRWIEAEIRP